MVVLLTTPPAEFAAERHCQSLGSGLSKTCSKNGVVTNRSNAFQEKMEREVKRTTVTLEKVSSRATHKNQSPANHDQPNGFHLKGGNESQIRLHLPNPGANVDSNPKYDSNSQQSELLKKLKGEAEEQERIDTVKSAFEADGPKNDQVFDVQVKEDRESQENNDLVKSAFEVTASNIGHCNNCAGREKHLLQKVMRDVEAQRKIASMKSKFEGNGAACLVSTNSNSAFVNGLKLLVAMQEKIDKNAKAKVKILWSMAMDAVEVLREIDVTKIVEWESSPKSNSTTNAKHDHNIHGNQSNTATDSKPKRDYKDTKKHHSFDSTTTGSDTGDSYDPAILRNDAMGYHQDGDLDYSFFTSWKVLFMSPEQEGGLREESNNLAAMAGEANEAAADLLQQISEQVASTDCSLKSWKLLLLVYPKEQQQEEGQQQQQQQQEEEKEAKAANTVGWGDEPEQETEPNILHQDSSKSSELLLVETEPNLLLHQASSKSSELLLVVYPWEEETLSEEAARSARSCGGTTQETATTLLRQVAEKVASSNCSMPSSLKTTKREQPKQQNNNTTAGTTLLDETREAVNAILDHVSTMVNDMFVVAYSPSKGRGKKPMIGSKTHKTHKKYRWSHRESVPFWYDYKRWFSPEGGS